MARAGVAEVFGGPMEKRVSFAGNSPLLPNSVADGSLAEQKIFLLSPANLKGVRGQRLLNSNNNSELGNRLREQGVSLEDLFCHASSLYFRGKLDYARFFSRPPSGFEGSFVITSSKGLLTPNTVVDIAMAKELASGAEIDPEDDRYRVPLRHSTAALEKELPQKCQVVLLGSVATDKYVMPLKEVFGRRLLFPSAFLGRGDMSRGALLLRCVRENQELAYSPAEVNGRKGRRRN
jgi:hypothetical protein